MSNRAPRVAVVGGGLAGLSAALALAERGCAVELFEARRNLGGRAGSFVDKTTGETIDHCQHVAMGCCMNYLDFCRRVGALPYLRRVRTLHFFAPDGRRCDFRGSQWLPSPLHLAGGLLRLSFLTLAERVSIGRALLRLARVPPPALSQTALLQTAPPQTAMPQTVGKWLQQQRQSPRQIERFWSVVLVSALGENIERASLAAARKVFVDGFMATPAAYEVYVPTVPLSTIYDTFVARKLRDLGVEVHLERPVERLDGEENGVKALVLRSGEQRTFDAYMIAVPWRSVSRILAPPLAAAIPQLRHIAELPAAPISAVHLWFDRQIARLDHAVLVGRLSQWVFSRGRMTSSNASPTDGYYYQVVISASRDVVDAGRDETIARVCGDLAAVFPDARRAKLLHARVVTDRDAVFAPSAQWESFRPSQRTSVANLFLCGDWTATGWPATMESAVRSGRLAAEGVLAAAGTECASEPLVTPDLPRGWLARWLIK